MSYLRAYSYHAIAGQNPHIPLHGGVGIRSERNRSGGTLGGIVLKNGKPHILTNLHVVGAYTGQYVLKTISRLAITKNTPERLGKVTDISSKDPKGAFIDAALAATVVPSISEIPGIGIPRGHTEPKRGMKVKMWGSMNSRGLLKGKIVDDDFDMTASKRHVFLHDMDTQHGDSGSLVFNEENMVVGINSHDYGKDTIADRASAIVRAYPGLSFVGKTGVMSPAIAEAVPLPAKRITPTPEPTPPNVTPAINATDLYLPLNSTNTILIAGVGGLLLIVLLAGGGGRR